MEMKVGMSVGERGSEYHKPHTHTRYGDERRDVRVREGVNIIKHTHKHTHTLW